MVEFLNSWVQGIVVAIIIATVIEMLVPEGNNKKYVKIIIGIYIIFTIVSPVISKLGKQEIDFTNSIDISKYQKEIKKYSVDTNQFQKESEKSIQDVYISNLKTDMKSKLEEKGYKVNQIQIRTGAEGEYIVEEIRLQLEKNQKEEIEQKQNTVQINIVKIEISKEETKEDKHQNKLEEKEIKEIKTYLTNVYEVKEENIKINE